MSLESSKYQIKLKQAQVLRKGLNNHVIANLESFRIKGSLKHKMFLQILIVPDIDFICSFLFKVFNSLSSNPIIFR